MLKYKVILNCKNVKFKDPMKMTITGEVGLTKIECEQNHIAEKLKPILVRFIYASNLHDIFVTSDSTSDDFMSRIADVDKVLSNYDRSTQMKGVKVLTLSDATGKTTVEVQLRLIKSLDNVLTIKSVSA